MKTYTREQLIKADYENRKLFISNPEKYCTEDGIASMEQSAVNIDFLLNLIV
jgi:hypothetical protein